MIGVRYHELVKLSAGEYIFGRFLADFSAKRGGFLPILWDAPKPDTYAVQDIGMVVDHLHGLFTFTSNPEDTLAVLHNKNRLVHVFSRSGWIQDTSGEVLSRSVTSCAGMTAKVTIIAQTRIGFLSRLRRLPRGEEAEDAYEVQLEYQPEELTMGMDDEKMVQMLKSAGPRSDRPPLALAEIVHLTEHEFIVRRLHLVIVDTWRQKWLARNNVDLLRRSMRNEAAGPLTRNTTPIRLSAENGRKQHQVRFVYGYALDGSTYPCYCICPTRTDDCSFQLMDSSTGYISAISQTASIRPLGVAHFYDAFSVSHELDEGPNLRNDALRAFELPEAAISDDLKVVVPWANQILPAAGQARAVPAEEDDNASVVSVASSGAPTPKQGGDTDSDGSQPSDATGQTAAVDLITDEDESDAESEEEFELSEKEQRFLREAYEVYVNSGERWLQQRAFSPANCRTPFADTGDVFAVFEKFINLPDSWPLMRILLPLDGLSLQVERIIACVAVEIVATHQLVLRHPVDPKRPGRRLLFHDSNDLPNWPCTQ